jgi:micrococcal nuclease
MYEYRATLLKVDDGDSIIVSLDLGFGLSQKHSLRFYGINTPELRDKDPAVRARALAAKKFVANFLPTAEGALTIRTIKDRSEKYGRYLAKVYVGDSMASLNDALVSAGLAVPFMVGE